MPIKDEYLDMNYFLYTSIIVQYKNNYPYINACCENILNGTYIINKHTLHKDIKVKMICVNNEDIDRYPLEDTEIYNKNSIFIKDIIQSDYIDLNELWEQTNRFLYIIYRIINNNIIPIMVSENKKKIMDIFYTLHDVYLIYLQTNTYYTSNYKMKEFIYLL